MFSDKPYLFKFQEYLALTRQYTLSGVVIAVLVLNIFSFASIAQENDSEDSLLRNALKSSLGEFYSSSDPISLFYSERNFEPFWI